MDEEEDSGITIEDLINRYNLDLEVEEEEEEEDLDQEEIDIKENKININLRMIRKLFNKLFIVN